MKTTLALLLGTALITGCARTSPKGGDIAKDKDSGFTISVPILETTVKQGQVKTANVSIDRGEYFKEDVRLSIKTTPGLNIDPSSYVIHASDKPEVQLVITAAKDAPIMSYRVDVEGTPNNGRATWVQFPVKVVAP